MGIWLCRLDDEFSVIRIDYVYIKLVLSVTISNVFLLQRAIKLILCHYYTYINLSLGEICDDLFKKIFAVFLLLLIDFKSIFRFFVCAHFVTNVLGYFAFTWPFTKIIIFGFVSLYI